MTATLQDTRHHDNIFFLFFPDKHMKKATSFYFHFMQSCVHNTFRNGTANRELEYL